MQTKYLFELPGFRCNILSSVLGEHGVDSALPATGQQGHGAVATPKPILVAIFA